MAIYFDDIVIHWATIGSHDECLQRVFCGMAEHHLTLNEEKCVFATPAIEFVGFCLGLMASALLNHRGHPPCSGAHLSRSGGLLPGHDGVLPQFSATVLGHNQPSATSTETWRAQQYNYRLQFTPARDNFVADLLSHSIPDPHTAPTLALEQDLAEHERVQLLHTPLQETVSLWELQDASGCPPTSGSGRSCCVGMTPA